MTRFVDLRSDTVTQPTAQMREAMFKAVVGDDGFGDDPTINELEAHYAQLVGKEAAVFVPSGVMANQIAVRVNTQPGDVIIAGSNFGTGSSREHAPIAIKAAGISCIIATSYARIFYRNAINIGLPVFECAEIVAAVKSGDAIEADIAKGLFTVNGAVFQAKPFPPYIQGIIDAGGLVPFVSRQLKQT